MRILDLYVPHVLSYLFPVWIVALGSAWKVVVMAELLSVSDGVGAALAVSRAQLDMSGTAGLDQRRGAGAAGAGIPGAGAHQARDRGLA